MIHQDISMASVVGFPDERYGEVVAAFLTPAHDESRPTKTEIQDFVRAELGRHKTPVHILWVGHPDSIDKLPVTASGKIQKNKLRDWGKAFLKRSSQQIKAKL